MIKKNDGRPWDSVEDLACPVVLTSSGCASGYLHHDDEDNCHHNHDGASGHVDNDHASGCHDDNGDDEDNDSHNNHDEHKQLLPMMFPL